MLHEVLHMFPQSVAAADRRTEHISEGLIYIKHHVSMVGKDSALLEPRHSEENDGSQYTRRKQVRQTGERAQ